MSSILKMSSIRYAMMPRANNFTVFLTSFSMVFVFYPYRANEKKKEQRKSMPSRQSGMSAEVSTRSESGLCDAHWQNDLNLSGIMPVGNTKIFATLLYIYSTLLFSVFG